MAIASHAHPASSLASPAETRVVHQTHTWLRFLFTAVPIVAGVDKFTNLLAAWETYLNPLVLRIVPVSASTFMHIVGVIEIAAGILVFLKPRIGAVAVGAWLLAIAGQLLLWGQFLDVAVRDIVIALSGPLVLARFSRLLAEPSRPDAP